MLKFFSFFFFLFVSQALCSQITATQKIPAGAMPGTDFIVETTINRGTVNGFMKFFQEIPEGLTASEIESSSGTFTFADGGAKIVWITPPNDETFTISYKVTVGAGISGVKKIPGKISYITNNERKVLELEPKTIMIGTATPPVKKVIPSTNPTPSAGNPSIKTTPIATTPAKTTPIPSEKKETNPTTNPTVFTKVPTTALPAASGKVYKVQIGAFSAKPKIEGVPEVSTLVLDNGITKYFTGNYSTYEDAVKRKKEMIEKGFQGAFIVAFEGGKIVK
ncbi:MAG: hypothetical protein H0X46_02510 [Bacteroidetes bacterium]|nr:hypothetical protein [Bacteroidota bacterium]